MAQTIEDEEVEVINILGKPYNVILFNDAVHSFDEVLNQLVAALKCSATYAQKLMMTAHTSGEVVVFTGNYERCEHVDSILAGPPASLRTSIQEA